MHQKAFSYLRYSTPEQGQGDSIRRQLESTRKYAADHGLDLDESSPPDRGISACHGKNRTEGNLGLFLADCRSGKTPKGSILLVESLDRLSREQFQKAFRLLLEIIQDHEIEVHTLGDRRIYGRNADLPELVMSLVVMSRANEESQRKSDRNTAVWSEKHRKARNGLAITSRVPAWLKAKKGERVQVIEARAKVVRDIFPNGSARNGSEVNCSETE
jgi:DNA invertase Pin-like site-specific DNA recombinase